MCLSDQNLKPNASSIDGGMFPEVVEHPAVVMCVGNKPGPGRRHRRAFP